MLNILIVDDSKSARKRIHTAVETSEVECNVLDEAIDGEDGLNKFLKNHPDLLITDIEMPKLNGEELIQKVRQIKPNMPIIVMTSMVNEKTKQTLMANKKVYVLHKPIDTKMFNILLNKIQKELNITKEVV